MSACEPVIETRDVTKRFGNIVAVRDLSLAVEPGEVYGFLGPNGAGKTTTINLLLSLASPTSGTIRLFGDRIAGNGSAARARLGVLPAHADVYGNLTPRQHLAFVNRVKGADEELGALCERVGLSGAIDRRAGEFSTGMTQRLKLAIALVGEPDLLVFDEPTNGLDPNGAREVRTIIREENERGATVFFSSHIMEQVEQTCDRIGILRGGELVAEDTIEGLQAQVGDCARMTLLLSGSVGSAADAVRSLETVPEVTADDETLEVVLTEEAASTDVINTITDLECTIQSFDIESTSLEDLFAAYTEGRGGQG